ncbi:acyl-CoA dehydrogenase [Corynebacterium diphtheriae]|uniref:acyl-CoA dehydrogenase family protein n=1 Tax=Corynebacterium diphtheriae TaxID=1717 RepID=UPI00092A8D04|nr:acyl-CoA dehydrogenase family protein [Corynebacterium diphtheriae]MBG9256632.1 acyl-CoA/acyl-ACP dehydrogenase [Corynebacterium diphtheriae bv. mitis]OJH94494.1 acyl-CoA dehydrogenase [Corynebacterium diphtheriae]CAB0518147.1 acyl-CoA dehydrogenase [Corynebacterium diphtheriae]CAB0562259.1 acyl-CoA dehydrogenase [Corynebacterium diphtheriae]
MSCAENNTWFEIGKSSVRPRALEMWERGEFDQDSWQLLADKGFWKIAVPSDLGGEDGDWHKFADALQSVASGGLDLGFCLSIIAHAGLVRTLVNYGTEEQQQEFLPMAMSGSVGLTALTEPESGSDVSRTATIARTDTGGKMRLYGTKDHITHGPIADLGLVLGRADWLPSKKDISVFVLDLNRDEVERDSTENLFGNRTSPTGKLSLNGYSLTERNILNPIGDGLKIIYDTICLDRLLYGVVAVPFLTYIKDRMLSFSTERIAFSEPIENYQYVQERIVRAETNAVSVEAVARHALDEMQNESTQSSMVSSMAKMIGAEALLESSQDLLRLLGHTGYETGEVTKLLSDAHGVVIAGGTVEMQKKNIFNQLKKVAE